MPRHLYPGATFTTIIETINELIDALGKRESTPPAASSEYARGYRDGKAAADAAAAAERASQTHMRDLGAKHLAELTEALGPTLDHRGWSTVAPSGLPPGAAARALAPRHGMTWTVAEVRDLINEELRGASHETLANMHGRSTGGVASKINQVWHAVSEGEELTRDDRVFFGVKMLAEQVAQAWGRYEAEASYRR